MRFMIQVLGFIIFAFLISNIVTNIENLSVEFDKHTNVEAEDNVYNTTSRNNTYIRTKKFNYYLSTKEIINLIAITVIFTSVTICGCICVWGNRCCIQYVRRNCSHFSRCCIDYIQNFPNNPPPPNLVIVHYQSEAADCQDIYQMLRCSQCKASYLT